MLDSLNLEIQYPGASNFRIHTQFLFGYQMTASYSFMLRCVLVIRSTAMSRGTPQVQSVESFRSTLLIIYRGPKVGFRGSSFACPIGKCMIICPLP